MALPLSDTRREPHVAARRPAPGELIEPGRALALSDFDPPDTSAGERLIRLAYRLRDLRLDADRAVPQAGQAAAAGDRPRAASRATASPEWQLRAGHFLVHGVKAPIAQVDFSPAAKLTPPFERTVHGFTWLRDLEASGARAQCAHTAERVLTAWLDANPEPRARSRNRGAAWKVGHAGHRLLGWLVHAPLLLSGSDKVLRARALAAMDSTARWLDRHVGAPTTSSTSSPGGARSSLPACCCPKASRAVCSARPVSRARSAS
jgi:uncharacterized heparinase superfamily protein